MINWNWKFILLLICDLLYSTDVTIKLEKHNWMHYLSHIVSYTPGLQSWVTWQRFFMILKTNLKASVLTFKISLCRKKILLHTYVFPVSTKKSLPVFIIVFPWHVHFCGIGTKSSSCKRNDDEYIFLLLLIRISL